MTTSSKVGRRFGQENDGARKRALTCLALGLLAGLLGGCASTRVANVERFAATIAPPRAIRVAVSSARSSDPRRELLGVEMAGRLQEDVVAALRKTGLDATPIDAGPVRPDEAVLHVTVTGVDPGNAAERMLIGFGTGRDQLQARIVLETPQERATVLAFQTSSRNSSPPGLIVPGGVAVATHKVFNLALSTAIDVTWGANDGLPRRADRTAAAIVGQLKGYYSAERWPWPRLVRG